MSLHRPEAEIAANRARYEEHQRKGLLNAPKALPPPSPRPAPPLDPAAVVQAETIPGGWYWGTRLKRGEALRIAQTGRHACVALVAWRADDPSERLNLPDTIKVQWTTVIQKGRVLFSDAGRVLLSVTEDSSTAHDVLAGGSTAASNAARYDGPTRNTRDNLVLAALKFGLSRRDLPMALSLFAPVNVDDDGRLFWRPGAARGDDFVDLRAETELLVALSNCPHPMDPSPRFDPPPVAVTRYRAPPVAPDDLCRTATAEARRGFANTDSLFA
jgi:urea carboxylase-associated protein 2